MCVSVGRGSVISMYMSIFGSRPHIQWKHLYRHDSMGFSQVALSL